MKRIFVTLLISLVFQQVQAQFDISQNCIMDLSMMQKLHDPNDKNEKLKLKYPVYTFAGQDYVSLILKVDQSFSEDELRSKGAMIGSRIGNILSIKYPISAISELYNLHNIQHLQVAGKIVPQLDKVRYDTKVDSVHLGINLPEAYSGKDVLIGVTDWGFDYSHPMFYDTLFQETRILAAWDQFKTSGPAPTGYSYGTEFSSPSELLAANADTAGVYSYATHGTHVAGIAGGSGAGLDYRGMAYESQFLFTSFLVDEGAVLDAWEWMYNISQSEGKRLVINMSWGLYYIGDLDGTSPLSQAIENYTDLGVLFVTSGGNNGNVNFHIEKDYNQDTLRSFISFYTGGANGQWGQSVHGWGEIGNNFSASIAVLNSSYQPVIESPWYSTLTTSTFIDSFLVPVTGDTVWFNLSMDEQYPSNNRPQMRLRVKIPPSGYSVILQSEATSGKVHYWNLTELTTDVGNWGMSFNQGLNGYTSGNNEYGIGMSACTDGAITVAAHSASYEHVSGNIVGGQGASFSSIGPLINGNMKPDISAPGSVVASSISSVTDASFTQIDFVTFNGNDYPFAKYSGTSMSSPCVAGIAALMLDANPYLSPGQVKDIILTTARQDNHTGTIPVGGDPQWGHGKINAYLAIIEALNTVGEIEIQKELDWSVFPNPSSDQLNITGIDYSEFKTQLFNLNGQLIDESMNESTIDVSNITPGTYILRIISNGKAEQLKVIIQ